MHSKFGGDTKLGGVVDAPQRWTKIQNDMNRQGTAIRNLVRDDELYNSNCNNFSVD